MGKTTLVSVGPHPRSLSPLDHPEALLWFTRPQPSLTVHLPFRPITQPARLLHTSLSRCHVDPNRQPPLPL
jgi:hypothetical protein